MRVSAADLRFAAMKYRTFGKLGWKVSEIGFGAWAIGGSWGTQRDDESIAALNKALDLGCNFIDTAQGYGNGRSERIISQVLKERKGDQRIYVATKFPPANGAWPPTPYDSPTLFEHSHYAEQARAIAESLRQLQEELKTK